MLIRWKNKDKTSNKNSSGDGSGSKKKRKFLKEEEEWNADVKAKYSSENSATTKSEGEFANDHFGKRIGIGISGGVSLALHSRSTSIVSSRLREEPRRHTLSGDHQTTSILHSQQFGAMPVGSNTIGISSVATQVIHPLHPRHLPPPHLQCGASSRHTTMDLEMGTKSRQKKIPIPRGYPPSSSAMLFDDDPGIMSEVETASTGFRRGGKQRSSLPVVRTPSKTLERPLGLVFLQYRNETKRALLPNEITSIDTVKALFVRSFPKQLTMEYLDSPHVKIYIHDSNKDMFYELEDLRSHLRDIRDRSVLRLFESDGVAGIPGTLGASAGSLLLSHWEDQSYFSEPEFDSEFQHQHIHKSKNTKNSNTSSGYYMSGSNTLPRSGSLMRSYSPAASVISGSSAAIHSSQQKTPVASDPLHGQSSYTGSPERAGTSTAGAASSGNTCSTDSVTAASSRYPPGGYSTGSSYEDPYYSQYSGTVTPVIDEEARIRVENMERQLANLTGLVQKALTHTPHPSSTPRDFLQVPVSRDTFARSADDTYLRTDVKTPKLGKDKSVSFEKSVSFSDEPPDMSSPKQHSPQHTADSKPTKPAIKSSTLPRMSSQERERNKPTPPPKPVTLATGQYVYKDLTLTPEMYNQLRSLQKKAKDLRQENKSLRRMSQAQAHTMRESIRDAYISIRAMLLSSGDNTWASGDAEKLRINRDEDLYKQEMLWLEKDLTGLESTVEELRGNVITRKTRVNMSDVENMALILSKASKTVADLKVRFPNLQDGLKGLLSSEMEKVMREEKFLKEEPDRLESALKRCKKLTGTLVTLKRLASVQEQRLPNSGSVEGEEVVPTSSSSGQQSKTTASVPTERIPLDTSIIPGGSREPTESSLCTSSHCQRSENALDALLDELQTFSRPTSSLSQISSMSTPQHLISSNTTETSCSLSGNLSGCTKSTGRAPNIAEIGRKGSVDSSSLHLLQPNQAGLLRRLHSYPSSSDTDTSPPIDSRLIGTSSQDDIKHELNSQLQIKPPVPERNAELLQLASSRRVPPPPPPRTSSKSPLASPTSPQLPPRTLCPLGSSTTILRRSQPPSVIKTLPENNHKLSGELHCIGPNNIFSTSNSSSCESVNSQEGLQNKKERQEQLDQRHQELLRKQKALQEQYARLQQLQRNATGSAISVPPAPPDSLKKTGSESNLLVKMGLGLSTATTSGSLTSLSNAKSTTQPDPNSCILQRNNINILSKGNVMTTFEATTSILNNSKVNDAANNITTINKVYETDIL